MLTFKTETHDRLVAEFAQCDPRLVVMLYALEGFLERECGIPFMTVTCLLRTAAEQAAINPGVTTSAHLDYRAADIRTQGWPAGVADRALAWATHHFRRDDRPDALFEGAIAGASTAPHLHLQLPAPRRAPSAPAFLLTSG